MKMQVICTYPEIQENLRVRLMDIRANRKTVERSVHRDVGCGYALVASLRLPGADGVGVGNFPEGLAARLGRGEEEILLDALLKTVAEEKARLTPLWEMVFGPGSGEEMRDMLEEGKNPVNEALVLTAGSGLLGASAFFYPGMAERIGEVMGDDYYILPSSVHELLIIPAKGADSPEGMARMVRSINEDQVKKEERLGNRVLLYRREDRTLEVAWDMDRQRSRGRER